MMPGTQALGSVAPALALALLALASGSGLALALHLQITKAETKRAQTHRVLTKKMAVKCAAAPKKLRDERKK